MMLSSPCVRVMGSPIGKPMAATREPTSGCPVARVNWWPVKARSDCTSARSRPVSIPMIVPVIRSLPLTRLTTADWSTTCAGFPNGILVRALEDGRTTEGEEVLHLLP